MPVDQSARVPRTFFDRWGPLALTILATCVLASMIWQARAFYSDDAYITLRYVDRLLSGQGLTWTDGERVEGFTHPLWLFQIAAMKAAGVDAVGASRVLGVVHALAISWLLWRARIWMAAALVIVTQPGLSFWSVSGLETAAFTFWLVLGVLQLLELASRSDEGPDAVRDDRRRLETTAVLAGLTLAAAGLIRPEGIGVGILGIVIVGVYRRDRIGIVLRAALAFAVPVVGYEIFRIVYYGDVVANSAHAKATGIPLSYRLQASVAYLGMHRLAWIPACLVCCLVVAVATNRRALSVLAMTVPLWLGVLVGGGDHMPEGRMLVPIVVLTAVAAALTGHALRGWTRRVAVIGVCAVAILQWSDTLGRDSGRDAAAVVGTQVGRFFESALEPDALVTTATAGSTPYFAPSLNFIDTLGLNDRRIGRRVPPLLTRMQTYPGHAKGDGDYVLSRSPDVILLGPAEGFLGEEPRQWFLTDFELLESPDFRARYRPYIFAAPVSPADANHPHLQTLLYEGKLPIIAWLRTDSPRAKELAKRGRPIPPP